MTICAICAVVAETLAEIFAELPLRFTFPFRWILLQWGGRKGGLQRNTVREHGRHRQRGCNMTNTFRTHFVIPRCSLVACPPTVFLTPPLFAFAFPFTFTFALVLPKLAFAFAFAFVFAF